MWVRLWWTTLLAAAVKNSATSAWTWRVTGGLALFSLLTRWQRVSFCCCAKQWRVQA